MSHSGIQRAVLFKLFNYREKALLNLLLPIFTLQFLYQLKGFIDLVMVSHIGHEAIIAVGLCVILFGFITTIMTLVNIGLKNYIAYYCGCQDCGCVSSVVLSSFLMTLVLIAGFITGFELFFKQLMIDQLSPDPMVTAYMEEYLSVGIYLIAGLSLVELIYHIFLGLRKNRWLLYNGLFVTVLNIALNYVLINGFYSIPAFGVKGAALGTLISFAASICIMTYILFTNRFTRQQIPVHLAKVDLYLCRQIIHMGLATISDTLSRYAIAFIILAMIMSYGLTTATAYNIGKEVEMFLYIILYVFCVPVHSVIARNIGAGKMEFAKQHLSALWSLSEKCLILGIVLLLLFMWPITSLFTPDTDVRIETCIFILFLIPALYFAIRNLLYASLLKVISQNSLVIRLNLLSKWGFRFVPAMALYHLGFSVYWLYGIIALENLVRYFMLQYYWNKYGFMKIGSASAKFVSTR